MAAEKPEDAKKPHMKKLEDATKKQTDEDVGKKAEMDADKKKADQEGAEK